MDGTSPIEIPRGSVKPRPRLSPPLKKAISYRRDHAYHVRNKDSFGKQWPRKKAFANRAYRRAVSVATASPPPDEDLDDRPDAPAAIRRRQVRKWRGTACPLGAEVWLRPLVRLSRTRRALMLRHQPAAGNSFKHVDAFLRSVITGEGPVSRLYAAELQEILDGPRRSVIASWYYDREFRSLLRGAFEESPDLEVRVREWIERLSRKPIRWRTDAPWW